MGKADHIIVLMLENRSFDHMLGFLKHGNPKFDGLKGNETCPDGKGGKVEVAMKARYRIGSPDHSHAGIMQQLLRSNLSTPYAPTNDGFVENYEEHSHGHGERIMSCFDPRMIPVFSTLAQEFAICTRWFASVPGETWPNREFAHTATSRGLADIVSLKYFSNRKTIFELLDAAGASWRIYHDDYPHTWCYASLWDTPKKRNRFQPIRKLAKAIEEDKLPNYTFVEPDYGLALIGSGWGNSMHPGQAPSADEFLGGERLVHSIYDTLRANPKVFEKTVFIITFDEHGGFYDHVHPPGTVNPGTEKWKGRFDFDLLGVRVPTLVISPWIARESIDDTVYDHTTLVQTVRTRFAPKQPPLTNRDKKAIPLALHHLLTDTLRKDLPKTRPLTTPEGVALEKQLTGGPFPSLAPLGMAESATAEQDSFHAGLLAVGHEVAKQLAKEGKLPFSPLGVDGTPVPIDKHVVLSAFWSDDDDARSDDDVERPAPVAAPRPYEAGTPFPPRNVDAPSARRPLQIYSVDPMRSADAGNKVVIDIVNDVIGPGPECPRLHVIDYDGCNKRYYRPIDLDDPKVLINRGLDPSEADPRFHQQMVFAVATRTLEHFDTALGRRFDIRNRPKGSRRKRKLRLHPHAFRGSNAFYSPEDHSISFGYFRADSKNPGPNLPGQTVYTCLSHDIIVHEMTHACIHRMRPLFLEPTNVDVLAFHEGFSDIVAIFQHFTYSESLRNEIQRTRADLSKQSTLALLAQQFGYASGAGRALRSALDTRDATAIGRVFTPHERGALLVGAVFDAFFSIYQERIKDLLRIATGGTGRLPDGDLHPDLVNRIANEASFVANSVLTKCIRAFEYLPPVDVTFGDFLRAMITADYELYPEDPHRHRALTIEAFRNRGIYPDNIRSLADESLLLECPGRLEAPRDVLMSQIARTTMDFGASKPHEDIPDSVFWALQPWAQQNAVALRLDPSLKVRVQGLHSSFRVDPNGRPRVELVAQFVQRSEPDERLGGASMYGGTTIVISPNGEVRYHFGKPLPQASPTRETRSADEEGTRRFHAQAKFLADWNERDPGFAYATDEERRKRIARRASIQHLHGGGL
ncbi:MAG: alkaline phosphatase family protein [Kofleriaceae bacterium]